MADFIENSIILALVFEAEGGNKLACMVCTVPPPPANNKNNALRTCHAHDLNILENEKIQERSSSFRLGLENASATPADIMFLIIRYEDGCVTITRKQFIRGERLRYTRCQLRLVQKSRIPASIVVQE